MEVGTASGRVPSLERAGFTGGVLPSGCPTRVVLDHVTSRWGVLLLIALSEESLRWGELRRVVEGISEKMLAQTLRVLEGDGFVHREAQPHGLAAIDGGDRPSDTAGPGEGRADRITTRACRLDRRGLSDPVL